MKKVLRYLFSLSILASVYSCQDAKTKMENTIKANEKDLFADSLHTMKDSLAMATLDLYSSFANRFKEDTAAAEYLFKSADLALGIHQPEKALDALNTLIERYPQSEKASSALFMQAFIYDNSLQDKDKAKEYFQKFMQLYPNHPLFASAKASFDQLQAGLSDEELVRRFEAMQDSLK